MSMLACNDGGTLFYEEIDGNPALPTLVFLHEGLGCQAMWRDFPGRLCRKTGCPGLVYDRLGFGRSSAAHAPRTIHYVHHSALAELPSVLAQVIAGRRFVLVGHSDGGSISLIYGAERPALLAGIITEAAHVFVEPETVAGIRSVDAAYRRGELGGLAKYHLEKTESVFRAWADTWLSDWFYSWNIEYLLPSIACPLLVMQGLGDQYGTGRQVDAIVIGASGWARPALLESCGHAPHLEQPETVLSVMSGFIDEIISRVPQETLESR